MTPSKRPILLIEDDVDVRATVSEILEEEGYAVLSASNGQQALGFLDAGAVPSLILLDLMMPVMDGWAFREQLRRRPALASVPVVVLSADGQSGAAGEKIEAAEFLRKPVSFDRLVEVAQRYAGMTPATTAHPPS